MVKKITQVLIESFELVWYLNCHDIVVGMGTSSGSSVDIISPSSIEPISCSSIDVISSPDSDKPLKVGLSFNSCSKIAWYIKQII